MGSEMCIRDSSRLGPVYGRLCEPEHTCKSVVGLLWYFSCRIIVVLQLSDYCGTSVDRANPSLDVISPLFRIGEVHGPANFSEYDP